LTNSEDIKAQLNRETAKISWQELQRFYARGEVIAVDNSLDLIQVASQFHLDNKVEIETLLSQGLVAKVHDQQAVKWHEQQASLWAVVIAPWVLVQEVKADQAASE
jgi:hypothetical protein